MWADGAVESVLDEWASPTEEGIPQVEHETIVLRKPPAKPQVSTNDARKAAWVVTFDGGAVLKEREGYGGFVIWGPDATIVVAQALWFGNQAGTVNSAEISALVSAMQWLHNRNAQGSILVLGDSQLVINFCNRRAHPSKPALFKAHAQIKSLGGKIAGKIVYRHIPRGDNALADWLANVAKTLRHTADLTQWVDPHALLFSQPPWPAHEVQAKMAQRQQQQEWHLAVARPPPILKGAGERGLDYQGTWRLLTPCEVCRGVLPQRANGGCRQCWGCARSLHLVCAGLSVWPLGPFHCLNCQKKFKEEGVRDITLDVAVMAYVCGGSREDIPPDEIARGRQVSTWLEWDGCKLWVTSAGRRRLPPLAERYNLVMEAAQRMGYPSGVRLAQLLQTRYYWRGIVRDCITICSESLPVQMNRNTFRYPTELHPTAKGGQPFDSWGIDLVTHLKGGVGTPSILVVAVCTFSKWVEAGPLADRQSGTLARWVHSEIVCRYGTPRIIRTDRGVEFQGHFRRYLQQMGIWHSLTLPQNPRANGLVERYNGVIVAGLRKILTAVPSADWPAVLPDVLAGLRMLPQRLGFQPYLVVFKQVPSCLGHDLDCAPTTTEALVDPEAGDQVDLVSRACQWWDVVIQVVKQRLAQRDEEIIHTGRRRKEPHMHFELHPGQKVLLKQRVPGKLRTRCEGPYTFLRAVGRGATTLELLSPNGTIRVAALGNIIPYRGRETDHLPMPRPKVQLVRVGMPRTQQVPRGGEEWDSSDVTFSSSDEGAD